ncbi:hypothetical protein HKX48_005330 [Thoreauomyces humboldtii]|nr:hypothetical protein HKX48_005330 [Thoreauomyces humboldtii]
MSRNETEPLLPTDSSSAGESVSSLRKTQIRVGEALETHKAHAAVLFLVLIDLLLVSSEILLSFLEDQDCKNGNDSHDEKPRWLELLLRSSIGILCAFCIEHALRLFAFGFSYYFYNPLHLFDAAVVFASLALELFLGGRLQEIVGLLIVLRFWRIVRIIDGVATAVKVEHEGEIQRLEAELALARNEIAALKAVAA